MKQKCKLFLGRWYSGTFISLVMLISGCAGVGIHYQQGQDFQAAGRLDEAIAAYYRAIEAEPDRIEAHLNLAEVLTAKGMKDAAIEVLENIHTQNPQHGLLTQKLADAYFKRGQDYRKEGKVSDAYEYWQKTLKLVPDHLEATAQLAKLYSDEGEDDKAAQQYQRLTQNRPRDIEAHRSLGLVYYKQGKYEQAIAEFQQVLRLNPGEAKVYNNLGSVYLQVGRLDDAIAAFEQAVSLDPTLAVAHNNWGTAFFKQGRYSRARQEWELALKLDAKNETARRNLKTLATLGY